MKTGSHFEGVVLKQLRFPAIAMALLVCAGIASARDFIVVQSTTSTQNSGLYEHLLPIVAKDLGLDVRVVAVGTGQAIRNARNCDGDVLLVHARAAEERFVAEGYGGPRRDLMYNDFVIVGPEDDPAGIFGGTDVVAALKAIASGERLFTSRGDDSGTHNKELELWNAAQIDPVPASGDWYREMGAGMGATLNGAVGMGAYALTDRATWLSFGNRGNFVIVVEGDDRLFNQYGIIPVSGTNCPLVKDELGGKFIDWMLSERGRSAIAAYRVGGKQLFFPNGLTN